MFYNRGMATTVTEIPEGLTPAQIRTARKFTTRSAGEALNLTHARISQIETRGTKDVDHIQAFADLYAIPFDQMRRAFEIVHEGK